MGCYLNWYVSFLVKPNTTVADILGFVETELSPAEYSSLDFLTDLSKGNGFDGLELGVADGKLHCNYNGEAGYGTADDLSKIMQAVADRFADWAEGPVEFNVWSDDDDRDGDTSFYGPRDVALTKVIERMRNRANQLFSNIEQLEAELKRPGKRVPVDVPDFEGGDVVHEGWLDSCKVKRG